LKIILPLMHASAIFADQVSLNKHSSHSGSLNRIQTSIRRITVQNPAMQTICSATVTNIQELSHMLAQKISEPRFSTNFECYTCYLEEI